jgi:hypothetical protein
MNDELEPPPEAVPEKEPELNSLEKLAEFTRRILQVPKSELPSKDDSDGMIPIDEPCPE